jgi:hypothetical protein
VVLATPPRPDGSVTPEVLYCAKKAGVTHLLKAGGAQAVAAMGWGTQTCPKVDKIFGPGNQFVTAAKMLLTNSEAMVAIDMPAGPSEVLVIAGEPRATCGRGGEWCVWGGWGGHARECARCWCLRVSQAVGFVQTCLQGPARSSSLRVR